MGGFEVVDIRGVVCQMISVCGERERPRVALTCMTSVALTETNIETLSPAPS